MKYYFKSCIILIISLTLGFGCTKSEDTKEKKETSEQLKDEKPMEKIDLIDPDNLTQRIKKGFHDNIILLLPGKDELSEAKCRRSKEEKEEIKKIDTWHPGIYRRRLEIHPKTEGRITLTQIENECEESMRKQLKENQHKKKLQFNFLGKRNNTVDSQSLNLAESHLIKRQLNDQIKKVLENINKDKSKDEILNSSEIFKNDSKSNENKFFESFKMNTGKSLLSQSEEFKNIIKELGESEDQDLKLLNILYQGLNSRDSTYTEVGPLVQTLKDIADRKIAIDKITNDNKDKPVSINKKSKCKNVVSLMAKIRDFKNKHSDKLLTNQIGSSPLNPTSINTRENICPLITKCLDKVKPTIISKNDFEKLRNSDTNIISLPIRALNLNAPDENQNDKPFFKLIHQVMSTITPNNSVADGKIKDMYKTLQDSNHRMSSDKLLESIFKELGNNQIKSDVMSKGKNKRYVRESKLRGEGRNLMEIKDRLDQSFKHSSLKQRKSWSKSDELKRLQKVASELKNKIDDLLVNIEGTVMENDEEEDEDDDEEDDNDIDNTESMQETKQENIQETPSNKKRLMFTSLCKQNENYSKKSKCCSKKENKESDQKVKTKEIKKMSRDNLDNELKRKKREKYQDIKINNAKFNSANENSKQSIYNDFNIERNNSQTLNQNNDNNKELKTFNLSETQNNFDVIKLANEFKKTHPHILEIKWDKDLHKLRGVQNNSSKLRNHNIYDIYNINLRKSNNPADDFNLSPIRNIYPNETDNEVCKRSLTSFLDMFKIKKNKNNSNSKIQLAKSVSKENRKIEASTVRVSKKRSEITTELKMKNSNEQNTTTDLKTNYQDIKYYQNHQRF